MTFSASNELSPVGRSELRVQLQSLDGVGNSVDDTLTRTMATGEEFEVAQLIIRRRLYAVMNRLFGTKFAANVLLHHVAMFKNLSSLDAILVREAKPDVSLRGDLTSDLPRFARALRFVRRQQVSSLQRSSARVTASGRPLGAVTGEFERSVADDAVLRAGVSSSNVGAFARAVERVLAVRLVIGAKLAWVSLKRRAAFLAFEVNSFDGVVGSARCAQSGRVAGHGAVFSAVPDLFGADSELGRAVSADKRLSLSVAAMDGRVGLSARCGAELGVQVPVGLTELRPAIHASLVGGRQPNVAVRVIASLCVVALSGAKDAMRFLRSNCEFLAASLAGNGDWHLSPRGGVSTAYYYNTNVALSTANTNGVN